MVLQSIQSTEQKNMYNQNYTATEQHKGTQRTCPRISRCRHLLQIMRMNRYFLADQEHEHWSMLAIISGQPDVESPGYLNLGNRQSANGRPVSPREKGSGACLPVLVHICCSKINNSHSILPCFNSCPSSYLKSSVIGEIL